MKPGKDRATVSQNIRDMIKSGKKPKEAIAASLASARKYSKDMMGSVDSSDDMGAAGDPVYPEGSDPQGLSENVMDVQALAKALQEAGFKSNNNSNSFEADDSVAGSKMSKGGQVQPEHGDSLGNKPDLDWIDADTAEPMLDEPMKAASMDHAMESSVPMSAALSDEAKQAIAAKKKKRMYGSFDPK